MTVVKHAYHHKDLRNALVEEAIAVLQEAGSGNVTLRDLARRLGVTHAAPYAHFADKKALLEAVCEVGFGRLADVLVHTRELFPDPDAALEALGLAYIRFARDNANLYRTMFADAELLNDPECTMSPEGQRAFGQLADIVAAMGPPPEMDVRNLSVAIWAQVHGLAMLEIDQRIDMKTLASAEDVLRLFTAVMIRGMRASR